jgi:tetratricopeptide (TPR) repeat protein/HEAT repeat protein
VALAGLYKIDGRLDAAVTTYKAAISDNPKETQARLALGQLLRDMGDKTGARTQYDEALPLLTASADKESTLRSLRTIALEQRDLDAARSYQTQLVKIGGGSLHVKAELGRELMTRGDLGHAEEEFKEVVKAAAGDNRALAPALLDLGRAQAGLKKNTEALDTLKRAQSAAGESGMKGEILGVVAELYRADNRLGELIAQLEKDGTSDFRRLVLLGGLYEETGAVDKALGAYRKALASNGKNIETRLRVVRILQGQGELEKAIAENEKLIQAAPQNPDFVFQLCETLLQRNDRAKALSLLAKLEQSAGTDDDVLARVADFYERIEEKDRAMKVFTRLAGLSSGDPSHLAELGDRYWQAGDKKKALEIWNRIRLVPNKARALAALGDVLLDHDMATEGLAALKEAIDLEPSNLALRKGFAMALERAGTGASSGQRTARFDEARVAWEELLEKSDRDRILAREARTHVVNMWVLLRQLDSRLEPLKRKLADDPPDLEAGRLLVEAQIRARQLPEAEASLARITAKAPGDEEAFLALERVRMMQHNQAGAIEVLGRLVEINPQRALDYYQRMAQYSAELYKDDDAIRYSEKAVALSPNNAGGFQKLAAMYRRRGDTDKAIGAYRQAIALNDRLYPVYMELAEMLVAKGEADEADRLYRRLLRIAQDEDLIAQAGRLSMQRNMVKDTLIDLENDLLGLSLSRPGKRVYRRLLVEVYGHLAFPLMQKVRFGTASEASEARAQLMKLGARGVKPLLDALGEEQKSQVNTAIEVLGYVGNKGAGPSLAAFALGSAEQPLRVRAMVATGALRDVAMLPRYEELVAPKDLDAVAPGDPVTIAAAWSVARMGDKKALPLLDRMLNSGAPEVRAFGAVGLGLLREKKAQGRLEELARAPDGASISRAAAALALGELGQPSASASLLSLASGPDPFVRSAALTALVRLGDPNATTLGLAALFATDEAERRVAADALAAVVSRQTARSGEALPVVVGLVDVKSVLENLEPGGFTPASRARVLVALEAEISKAAASAAGASPEQAMRVADALLARSDGKPGLAPFSDEIEAIPAAERAALEKAAERVHRAVVPAFAALIKHPSAAVKTRAIRVLEGRPEDEATRALGEALNDADPAVVRAALAAARLTPGVKASGALVRLLGASPSWSLRAACAEALGPMASREGGAAAEPAWKLLTQVARTDTFSAVREAALRSLASAGGAAAQQALGEAAASDPEPEIRELAAKLLGSAR